MLKFGSYERKEFSKDVEGGPSWKKSYKITFKNQTFLVYAVVVFSVFTVYNILLVIIPLYAVFVLKMENPGLILFVGLIFGVFSTPLWRVLRKKWGIRKTFMVSLAFWAFTLLLLALASDEVIGFIVISALGFGLGGSMFLYDLGIAEIIDDDEVRSGYNVRREGAYYGVITFFNRLSIAINALIIGIIFIGTGWDEYNPRPGADIILGLRFLVGIWPAIILCIGIICLYFYPIHGERLKENEKMLKELHAKKKGASALKI
jgi:GPH family glycoside/pentoside/hexuronide:cation symporter